MKLLNLENCQHVSGGDVSVSVTANIPAENTQQFVQLFSMFVTGQLDAKTLAYVIDTNAGSFNDMPIEKLVIGNYTITRG